MPIASLPASTIRTLGSTQSLTDPCSLVKELLDNAIDANTSSIDISISFNTLDKIVVRDNGIGIAPEDRSLLCKRYCTSKIRDLDDLSRIGGRSLGFRGEALASALEMSGHVGIVTRIDGEATGVQLGVAPEGVGMVQEKKVSHPVGTTVTVTDFLKNLPVRRQTALKERAATTQLSKIKRLLQAYAQAKPRVRLSFKVTKAKGKSVPDEWIYAPKPKCKQLSLAELRQDAATKVFGKKVTAACRNIAWSARQDRSETELLESGESDLELGDDTDFIFQALVPNKDYDVIHSVAEKPQQFISIDTRPVSSSRGTPKQIVSIFKKHFKAARSKQRDSEVDDPPLCLDISCKPGSYDANIEPAKDDVLFQDPERLLGAAKTVFELVYGKVETKKDAGGVKSKEAVQGEFDLLLSSGRKPQGNSGASEALPNRPTRSGTPAEQSVHADTRPMSPSVLAVGRSMFDNAFVSDSDLRDLAEDALASSASEDEAADETDSRDISISNPWAIAKLNAANSRSSMRSNRPRPSIPLGLPTPERQHGDMLTSPASTLIDDRTFHRAPSPSNSILESPPLFPFPQQRRNQAEYQLQASASPSPEPLSRRQSQGALDGWLQDGRLPDHDGLRASHFVPVRQLVGGTSLSDIPDVSQRPRRSGQKQKRSKDALSKPFVPPVRDPNNVWDAGQRSQQRRLSNHLSTRPQGASPQSNSLNLREVEGDPALESIHPDLAATLEYEHRKAAATKAHKARTKEQQRLLARSLPRPRPVGPSAIDDIIDDADDAHFPPSAVTNSPHRNRYLAAKAALHNPLHASSPTAQHGGPQIIAPEDLPPLPPTDPRHDLLRIQQHQTHPTTETNTSPHQPRQHNPHIRSLPLETVPPGLWLQDLTLHLPAHHHAKNSDSAPTTALLNTISSQLLRSPSFPDTCTHEPLSTSATPARALEPLSKVEVEAWKRKLRGMALACVLRDAGNAAITVKGARESLVQALNQDDVVIDLSAFESPKACTQEEGS